MLANGVTPEDWKIYHWLELGFFFFFNLLKKLEQRFFDLQISEKMELVSGILRMDYTYLEVTGG
jgi:hypothetical protein